MPNRYLLVDGHSVLFQVDRLRCAQEKSRRQARESLIQDLQRLHDTSEWLVSVVFDGTRDQPTRTHSKQENQIAIMYAARHATADSIIEQIVARHPHPQEITVVTADHAEQNMVESLGAHVLSPQWLISEIDFSESAFQDCLKHIQKKAQW